MSIMRGRCVPEIKEARPVHALGGIVDMPYEVRPENRVRDEEQPRAGGLPCGTVFHSQNPLSRELRD